MGRSLTQCAREICRQQTCQPRSEGLSSPPPLSYGDKGGGEERPWERGCRRVTRDDF